MGSNHDTKVLIHVFLPDFSESPKQIILVELQYCMKKWKIFNKLSLKIFQDFTDNIYDVRIKQITVKVKYLFKLKSQKPYLSCVIYDWTGKRLHNGETKRNTETRWGDHKNTDVIKAQNQQTSQK